jgi:4-amino-4-deoxy-L-arabinose transferase-like glycosyltransferase
MCSSEARVPTSGPQVITGSVSPSIMRGKRPVLNNGLIDPVGPGAKPLWRGMLLDKHFLAITFLAFVGIRLAVILLVPVAEPFSDAGWYLSRAIEIVQRGSYSENGVPTAYWPVGYPAFLAFLFKATGPSLLAARLANLIFAAGTFWLLYFFTRRSFDDELTARCAVVLLTIYPNNIAYTSLLLTETLYTFLLLAALTLILSKRAAVPLFVAGVILGLATLVKVQTLLALPIVVFLATLDGWSLRGSIAAAVRTILIGLVCITTVLPWSFRNLNALGDFVLVSTNGGMALLSGNNPSMSTDLRTDYAAGDPLFSSANFSVEDQVAADKRARTLALQWMGENPGKVIALIPKKVFRLWAPDGEGEWGFQDTSFYKSHESWFRGIRVINQAFYVSVLALFFLGALRLIRTPGSPKTYVGIAFVAVSTVTCVVFSGQSRYHFPSMPFIFAYAAWFLIGRKDLASAGPVTHARANEAR